MILPYVREIYLIIFSSLLQHGVIIQSVIKERGAQNHVLSLFDTFSWVISLKPRLKVQSYEACKKKKSGAGGI
jgi:hypothetical protein